MNRFNQILGAALAVQVVIAGGLYFGSQPPAADQVQMALLNTEQSQIDRITIDEGDAKQTVISKVDGQWQLPDYHQLPANQGKVSDILTTLETTKSGWPVATTESSRERFEVADDNFQKKVVLSQGGNEIQTLYLGTSPGFRQLHVRRAGEDEVYAVKLNSYDFPSQQTNWLDKTLLQPKGDIASLKGADFSFNKQGDDWQLTEGEGKPVKAEIEKITSTLARLNIQSAEEKSVDQIDYELTVKAAGDALNYRFFKEGSDHFVSRDDYSQAFKINKSDYEKITGQTAKQLVKHIDVGEENTVADSVPNESAKNLTTSDNEQEVTPKEKS